MMGEATYFNDVYIINDKIYFGKLYRLDEEKILQNRCKKDLSLKHLTVEGGEV